MPPGKGCVKRRKKRAHLPEGKRARRGMEMVLLTLAARVGPEQECSCVHPVQV